MSVPAIGGVVTPSGFSALSAQGQVILNWNFAPLATIYYINRSTDNVTFTNIASTTSLSYNDTSGVLGTVYYYNIQAATALASSVPSPSIAALSLNPGQTTVGNLVLEVLQRINKENSQFYTHQELVSMVSQSYKELYGIMQQKFGDDYFVAIPYVYNVTSSTQLYPLPADFKALLGVDLNLSTSDPTAWVTIKKFEFIQRNQWSYPSAYSFFGVTNLRYRIMGNNLMLIPTGLGGGGQILRIWYVPRPSQLINDTDTVDAVAGWEEYLVVDTCIKALAKEESDVSVFAAQKMALLKRIEEEAENRDIGEPQKVSDIKSVNTGYGDYGNGGWGGGGWGSGF